MIRAAQPADALQAAPLLCAAWGHLTSALTGTGDHTEAERIIAALFSQPGNRVSHENTLVAEAEGQVVGVAVCYHGSEAEALDQPLTEQLIARTGDPAARIRVEAQLDEFYLDTLSVHPDYQRRGIGAELLRAFERRATERGHRRLGLLVETDNESAIRLYEKAGYTSDGTIRLAGASFEHREKHR